MKTFETCVVSENPTEELLPTDEGSAASWFSMIPNLGDMIVRLFSKAMTRLELNEVSAFIDYLSDEAALGCILAAREDGTWSLLDRYEFSRLDIGQDGCWVGLPEPTTLEPPRVEDRHMVPVKEVVAARDRSRLVFRYTGQATDRKTYEELDRRLVAEFFAHALNRMSPKPGDLCLIIYGAVLLFHDDDERLLAELLASKGIMSCEIGLGDGRWTAYDPDDMLDVVMHLRQLVNRE